MRGVIEVLELLSESRKSEELGLAIGLSEGTENT